MTYDRRRHASQYANISPVSDQQELPAIPVPVSAATYSPTEGWDYYQEDGETRIHEPTVEPVVGSHPGGQQYQHSRPPGSQYPQTATNPEAWIQDESPSSNEPSEWNHQNNEPYCLAGHGAYPSVEIRRNQESVGPHDKSREGYIDGNRGMVQEEYSVARRSAQQPNDTSPEGQSGGGDENEGRVTALYHTVEGWIYRGDEPRHWSDPALQQTAGEVPYMPDVPASRPNPNQLFPDPIGIEWAPAGSRSTIVYDLSALQPPSHLNTPYMQDYTEEYPLGTHVSAGATRNQPGFEAEPVYPAYPITIQPHPRDNIARWKWKTLLGVGNLLMLINGYDISNVASLQALLYDAFGHVELLPWIGLTYFLCDLAMTPLARKLFQFYEVKFLTILSLLVMISGTALAAAAPNLDCFIAGRALMGFGTALSYQGVLTFTIAFSYPHEVTSVQTTLGTSFAAGMIVGPAIGASFAQSQHATWRWAFYLALPLLGIALALIMILQPSYRFASEKPLSSHFRQLDWVGNLLHMGTFVLLGTACIFSGPTWPWKSGSTVAVWAMFGILAIAYMTQQFFSIGTTPERRIIPTSLFHSRRTTAIWLCTFGAASAFCVVLYYIPLYLDFAQGKGFLDTAVGLLPFTGVFGLTLFLSSQLLPLVRFYMPLFASSAVLLLIGGGLLQTISTTIPEAKVLGYMVFIGAGAGTVWQLALHLNILMFLEPEEHLDAATLHHMALAGGAAVTLAVAGAVYQNVGFRLLQEAVGTMGFSEQDIRQLLVGRHSYVITGEREATIGEILTKIILRCLSMSLAAGAVCFIAACFLKLEAPEFRRPNKKSGVEAVQQIELNRK